MIDRSKFPNAGEDYTPAQRRLIDKRLAESEAGFKRGRTYGPFDTAEEMIAHMQAALKQPRPSVKTKRQR